jgi:azurin
MDTHHDESHESGASIWSAINILLGLGFAIFSLVAGVALIQGGLKNSFGDKDTEAETVSSTMAPAASGAPAAAPAPAATDAPAPVGAEGDTAVVVIKPGPANPMSFDVTSFTVKPGQKVKLTFNNESTTPLQHNLVLGTLGSKDAIVAMANAMMTDMGKWMAAGFIPEGPEVLAHTKLLNPKESQTIEFTAPEVAGDYPYICTFPGHSLIMQGTMKVAAAESEAPAAPAVP